MSASLIGRDQECDALRRLLRREEAALVTVTGPGGMGKTRLALTVAQQAGATFEHGAAVVLMAGVRESALVATALAQALGLQNQGGQPPWQQVKDYLCERELLLVLDNFEQVLEAAPLVGELLREAPRLKVLVTSRVRLHLSAEQEFPLGPLELPALPLEGQALPLEGQALGEVASVQLFVQRAQALQPGFALQPGNAQAVAALCVRLDGWPLAIELAAARIKLMTPPQMLQRLQNRLGLLVGGPVDQPQRQRTLRATLDWSHELLGREEHELFARLSVFNGGAPLYAIEAVCAGAVSDVMQTLQSLVDHSLLQQQGGRFTLLETVREYAAEQLQATGRETECRLAHAQYYLALAEQAEAELSGPKQRAWFDRLFEEVDNFRQAIHWSLGNDQAVLALRMAGALGYFCMIRGLARDGLAWLDACLAAADDADGGARAKGLEWAGMIAGRMSELPRARRLLEQALQYFRSVGDLSGVARTLTNLGWVHDWHDPNDGSARRVLEEALAAARASGDRVQESRAAVALGWVIARGGELQSGVRLLEEGIALARLIGDETRLSIALANLGAIYCDNGRVAEGCGITEEALARQRTEGHRNGVATCLANLGEWRWQQGDLAAAVRALREALSESLGLGAMNTVIFSLENLANICLQVGVPLSAARLYGAAAARRDRLGISVQVIDLDKNRSTVRERLGAQAYDAAFAEGRSLGLRELTALVESVDVTSTDSSRAKTVDGLTDRELEVLRLVAQGLSDKQLAAKLNISPMTASKHVANLLGKTMSRNRLALTLWAIERGLVERE